MTAPRRGDPATRVACLIQGIDLAGPSLRLTAGTAGSVVAGTAFVEAHLRYANTPTDFVALPTQSAAKAAAIQAFLSRVRRSGEADVRVLGPMEFEERLRAGAYRAIHDVVRARPGLGAYIRERFSACPLPYTCTHYSISPPIYWLDHVLPGVMAESRSYDAILVTSRSAEHTFRRMFAAVDEAVRGRLADPRGFQGQFIRVPYGMDVDRFRPREKAELRERLDLPKGAILVYWTGRFNAATKADLAPLLMAFAEARRRLPNTHAHLVMCGEDSAGYAAVVRAAAVAEGLAESVTIRTVLPSFAVPLMYAAADLFVAPSDYLGENFGLTVVEAMATGLPVIASAWDGYKDTVENGVTGLLIPTLWARCDTELSAVAMLYDSVELHLREGQSVVTDVDALTEGLVALLSNRDLREEMGLRGRERAVSHYAWPTVIARHEEIWHELAAMAAADRRPPSGNWRYPCTAHSEVFSGHPSAVVTDDTLVHLSERGAAVVRGRARLTPDLLAAPLLDMGSAERLLRCAAKGAAWKPVAVGRVLEAADCRDGVRRAEALRHLMWLLKYDLLEVAAP